MVHDRMADEDRMGDRVVSPPAGDDMALPFAVEALDVRGRLVRLGPALDAVLARHNYPPAVSRVVGEAMALTVLLGSALKLEGRFQLQTRSSGPVNMIVVDFDAPDRVRACARFDADALAAALAAGPADTGALLGAGHMAMTIDQGNHASRYQGIVPLEGQSLEECAHMYFRQSEQIPTLVRLAVGEELTSQSPTGRRYRAGGLMVQFMPHSVDRLRQADLSPGDAPAGHQISAGIEDDAWREARMLAETTEAHELLDPLLPGEQLLYRLYHERGVRAFPPQPVREACQCSRERIMGMLTGFSHQERVDMVADDGLISVTCEFCSRQYDLDPGQVEAEIAAAALAGSGEGGDREG